MSVANSYLKVPLHMNITYSNLFWSLELLVLLPWKAEASINAASPTSISEYTIFGSWDPRYDRRPINENQESSLWLYS